VSFTTVCPSRGAVYRLLDKYRDHKLMCSDCRKPFRAQDAHADAVEVEVGSEERVSRGWLLVCPSCGHTEVVPDDPEGRDRCSRCATPLAAPVTPSKRIRKQTRPPAPPRRRGRRRE
jgi:hypothetical protein